MELHWLKTHKWLLVGATWLDKTHIIDVIEMDETVYWTIAVSEIARSFTHSLLPVLCMQCTVYSLYRE